MHRREFLRWLAAASAAASPLGWAGGCDEGRSAAADVSDATTTLDGLDGASMGELPWWLRGNYAPVPDELEAFDLEVIEGAIPPELDGVLLRNGANPVSGSSPHWFLGDGMLHGVRLQGGSALWYRNRFVQTHAYRAGGSDDIAANRANTALVWHAGHLLALYEGGVPHALDPETLETIGEHDFGGLLERPMSAHPKIDPVTGEMWFIGYSPISPFLTLHVIDASGALIRSDTIEIPRSTMMHDFQLTATHVVLMDLPIIFDLDIARETGFPFRWDPSAGARIGLLPRNGPASEVVWIEVDLCYVFHTFNAYDATDGRVVLEGCRLPSLWANGTDDASEPPSPWRWTLDPTRGTASEERLYDRSTDFPRIDPRLQGLTHRVSYGLEFAAGDAFNAATPTGILKHDRASGQTDVWATGDFQPDEALFIPLDAGEDEGYLMSMLYDTSRGGSQLVILDATQVSSGPVARVAMPRRVPFGFHGAWVPLGS